MTGHLGESTSRFGGPRIDIAIEHEDNISSVRLVSSWASHLKSREADDILRLASKISEMISELRCVEFEMFAQIDRSLYSRSQTCGERYGRPKFRVWFGNFGIDTSIRV